MCAHGVKVSKNRNVKIWIRYAEILEDLFDHEFGLAVGISDIDAYWAVLGEFSGFLQAINRGGRRENQLFD